MWIFLASSGLLHNEGIRHRFVWKVLFLVNCKNAHDLLLSRLGEIFYLFRDMRANSAPNMKGQLLVNLKEEEGGNSQPEAEKEATKSACTTPCSTTRSIHTNTSPKYTSMVKLASARESRLYGPWRVKNRWEYITAGVYIVAVVLLLAGFLAQLGYAGDAKSGSVVILIALAIVALANLHDLAAHLAGVELRSTLLGSDPQLVLVEFAAPSVHALGSVLIFVGMALLLSEEGKNYESMRVQKHALRLLVAGPALWVIGSVHDSCQIYERADGHVQILQKGVQIQFLVGSLLFLVGGILNIQGQVPRIHHSLQLLGWHWVWFGIWGSFLFLVGGLVNVVKVFKMQQRGDVRLERLRGGARERISRGREGQDPLLEEHREKAAKTEAGRDFTSSCTPYKDVLLSQSQ